MTRLFAGTPFDIPPNCDRCGRPESECTCTPEQLAAAEKERRRAAALRPPMEQTARIRVESRKGKRRVTVIAGLTAAANDLPDLLSRLQTACGSGGTVREDEEWIELQGEQVDAVRRVLEGIGYRVHSSDARR